MYKLFTDKTELFECSIKLEGASLTNSKARLIIESSDVNLLFNGEISGDGKCKIPIKKLKGLLNEDTKGTIRLEVIADDTYFSPWESDFAVQASKKLTVEVKSQQVSKLMESTEPKIVVENVKNVEKPLKTQDVPMSLQEHVQKLFKLLSKEKINIKNITYKTDKLNNIVASYLQENTIPKEKTSEIVAGIVEKMLP